jgi:hypothetical protein
MRVQLLAFDKVFEDLFMIGQYKLTASIWRKNLPPSIPERRSLPQKGIACYIILYVISLYRTQLTARFRKLIDMLKI